jgi:DivIVA domain-containing protein
MMPLTPADIHNMAFKKSPLGKRGYDEEEVDELLDEVEQQLIRLMEENEALRGQMHHAGPGGTGTPASGMAVNAEFTAVTAQLERVQRARARAEQNAHGLQIQLEQARTAVPTGSALSADGDDSSTGVLMMAQRTADDHLHDARRESDALLSAAREKSEQVTREARLKAAAMEGDARRNHTESMTSLAAKRAALIAELERLSQLAQSYQAALGGHLTQQLQELDGTSQAPADRETG